MISVSNQQKYDFGNSTMNCPVCPFEGVPDDAAICPNCATDLSPVHRVRGVVITLYNRALRLAKRGDINEAMTCATSVVCLDQNHSAAKVLLGKILWQRGQYGTALKHWENAIAADPNLEQTQKLIDAAHEKIKGRKYWILLRRTALIACSIVFLSGAIYKLVSLNSRATLLEGELTQQMTINRQLTQFKNNHSYSDEDVEQLQAELTDRNNLIAQFDQSLESSRAEIEVLQARLSARKENTPQYQQQIQQFSNVLKNLGGIQEISIIQEGNRAKILFNDGLFSSAPDSLTEAPRATLARIGTVLKMTTCPISVLIEGHTDNLQVKKATEKDWKDNWSLGLKRSTEVISLLKENFDSLHIQLMSSSSGEWAPPYPNNTPDNRKRNRTVIVYLTPEPPLDPTRWVTTGGGQ